MSRRTTTAAVLDLERKSAATAESTGLLSADDQTGVVETIVSVTGIVDDVDDLILPGAYAKSLAKRKPKGIHAHDWAQWTSKALEIREVLPGDPELEIHASRYRERTGKSWPKSAGCLYVKTQYNLETQLGRDAYSNVKFFDGESEWSIGYTIPEGGAVRRKEGGRTIRVIKELNLYEYSSVLFGANAMTGTLSVKEAAADDLPAEVEEEGVPAEEDAPQPVPEPTDGDEDGDEDESEELAALHQAAEGPLLDEEIAAAPPEPEEEPEEEEVVPPPAPESKAGAPGVADTPGDAAAVARLKNWYLRGEAAAKIRWGQSGDFGRCVRIAGKHMDPEKAKGFCSNLHQASLGVRPGQEGGRGGKSVEVGGMFLAGSLEELAGSVKAAVVELLAEADAGPWPTIRPDEDAAPGWMVAVHGTFPDRVVATRHSADGMKSESFEVPYRVKDGQVELAEPQPVELVLEAEGAPEDLAGLLPGDLVDLGGVIENAAMLVKTVLFVESKAGRVLSARNVQMVKTAVENLVSVLRAAGVEVGKPAEPEDQPETMGDKEDAENQDTTAPSGRKTVVLDPAEVAEGRTLLELLKAGALD